MNTLTAMSQPRKQSIRAATKPAKLLSNGDTIEKRIPRETSAKSPHILTRREREIANLVGRGLSNREISEELEISERTVEGHVSRILRKLKLRSWIRIAAWVIEHLLWKRISNPPFSHTTEEFFSR